jgi:small nuclear ribonucleoprotein (snRNP)-like protein
MQGFDEYINMVIEGAVEMYYFQIIIATHEPKSPMS